MTYGELKEQFNTLLNRTDITTALTELFINQAQTRAQRTLRIPAQEKTLETVIPDPFTGITVPSDFLSTIAMIEDTSGSSITYLPLSRFLELEDTTSGVPVYFTRQSNKFKFKPTPVEGTTINLVYYGELTPFVDDADVTTISAIAPDLIIYGALSYAADYYLDERAQSFEQRYQAIAQDLQNQAYDAEGPGVVAPAYSFGEY